MDLIPFWLDSPDTLYYTNDRDGDQVRSLALRSGEDRLWRAGLEHHSRLALSPSGESFLGVALEGERWTITVLDRAGVRGRLAVHEARDAGPSWSPDGQSVVFASRRSRVGAWQIFAVSRDDTNIRRLTESEGRNIGPRWMPSGEEIIFSSNRDGSFHLYLMSQDGSNERRFEIAW